ncbi:TetR/AcrR family transcriptional regulator [Actinoplanes palleronii]|uniref:TetR family transcriptional regulator n=1 Tax=Actinoplanes palleronii TaxID=113570 RepID=A0ABQ4BC64_9ACTN|nr:TetR/AcrR family transcriptional regulator [Actinoplanes palleronii]GIE68256.1 TetR family transcriptional regulator [Actinoplanes palleronii]
MDFKRAHTEEQRSERRRQILDATAVMLTEMPVAKLSLNELSRRVGLAKSNVLRYFESREAILLELLDAESRAWLTELDRLLPPAASSSASAASASAAASSSGGDAGTGAADGSARPGAGLPDIADFGSPRERGDRLAAVLAETVSRRPVLCDLWSAQATVLEHNVSAAVALEYKRATARALVRQIGLIQRCLPELGQHDATRLVATIVLTIAAAWPACQPSEALRAAYAADPEVAAMQVDFTDLLRQTIAVSVSGLLVRGENLPFGPVSGR